MNVIERLLHRACSPTTINGCRQPVPLLERFTLIDTAWGSLRVHHFLRSDEDRATHDHPWSFISLILAGGYDEEIPVPSIRRMILDPEHGREKYTVVDTVRERRNPGQLLYRPARWAHRVELAPGKEAWTLIWTSRKSQAWGFFERTGWIPRELYHAVAACDDGPGETAMQ